jgi:hypothetical protein
MTFKRLYYDFAVVGGAVGPVDLGQGSSYEHQLLWQPVAYYVFTPLIGCSDADLGTALQPQLLFANFDFTGLGPGLLYTNIQPAEALFSSHWQITFNTSPATAGLIEFIFDSHRRQ